MGEKKLEAACNLFTLIDLVTNGNFHQIENIKNYYNPTNNSHNEFEIKVVKMISSIIERDKVLEEQAAHLVDVVNQRTKELEQQKMINIQTSKMSALGEMAGGIAHEINTPLATMKMIASITQREIENEIFEIEPIVQKLIKLNLMIDRIAKIVKGLKTFSRDGSNDPFIKVSLKKIIEETIDLCKEKTKSKDVMLFFDSTNLDLFSDCREVQISQVILNLISNAVDAVENLEEKWIRINLSHDNDYNYISVTDSGSGILPEIRNRIFEPFFTTKGLEKGTGLGLSISHGIIKSHKGELYVDSNSPNTCFMIKLLRSSS